MRAKILLLALLFAPTAIAQDEPPLPLELMVRYAQVVAENQALKLNLSACMSWSYTAGNRW